MQRSLFDDGSPASQSLMSVPHNAPPMESAPASTPLSPIPAATAAPAVSRHPQAQREIHLKGHLVAYALKRGRRRSIGFVVGMDGLSVSAPKWVGLAEIDGALLEKGDWILRKIREQQDRARRLLAAKIEWRDGTTIPYLGRSVIVVLDARAGTQPGGAVLDLGATGLPGVPGGTLSIGLPHTATPEQMRDAVQSWLQREARRVFEERCRHFTQRLGVQYKRLSLSSAQTRWGSASVDGSIR